MGALALRTRLTEWIAQMRKVASEHPETGACAVGTAMEMWAWTFDHVQRSAVPADAERDGHGMGLADALAWLVAARAMVLEVDPSGDALLLDACHAHVVRTCGEVGRLCAELLFGTLRHPAWETDSGRCYHAADLEMLEQYVPGLASCARAYSDVIEADGSHPEKAGPCVPFDGLEEFTRLRTRLDGCLAGGYIARQRAARKIFD